MKTSVYNFLLIFSLPFLACSELTFSPSEELNYVDRQKADSDFSIDLQATSKDTLVIWAQAQIKLFYKGEPRKIHHIEASIGNKQLPIINNSPDGINKVAINTTELLDGDYALKVRTFLYQESGSLGATYGKAIYDTTSTINIFVDNSVPSPSKITEFTVENGLLSIHFEKSNSRNVRGYKVISAYPNFASNDKWVREIYALKDNPGYVIDPTYVGESIEYQVTVEYANSFIQSNISKIDSEFSPKFHFEVTPSTSLNIRWTKPPLFNAYKKLVLYRFVHTPPYAHIPPPYISDPMDLVGATNLADTAVYDPYASLGSSYSYAFRCLNKYDVWIWLPSSTRFTIGQPLPYPIEFLTWSSDNSKFIFTHEEGNAIKMDYLDIDLNVFKSKISSSNMGFKISQNGRWIIDKLNHLTRVIDPVSLNVLYEYETNEENSFYAAPSNRGYYIEGSFLRILKSDSFKTWKIPQYVQTVLANNYYEITFSENGKDFKIGLEKFQFVGDSIRKITSANPFPSNFIYNTNKFVVIDAVSNILQIYQDSTFQIIESTQLSLPNTDQVTRYFTDRSAPIVYLYCYYSDKLYIYDINSKTIIKTINISDPGFTAIKGIIFVDVNQRYYPTKTHYYQLINF